MVRGVSNFWSVGVLGLGIGGLVTYFVYRYRKKTPLPSSQKWILAGYVKNLDIFPLRSGAAIDLDEVDCTKDGFSYCGVNDRQFLLLLNNGKSVYAGTYPILLSIKTEVWPDRVKFSSPGFGSIEVDLHAVRESGKSQIYPRKGFNFKLIEGHQEHHKWFSTIVLGKPEGLKFYLKDKPLVRKHWWSWTKPEYFPVMLMTQKSVDDLNARLSSEDQVNYQQFRPNILVYSFDFLQPFDEDTWMWVAIHPSSGPPLILKYNSLCYRCILPNINVKTCERNPNFQPLKTLKQYRIVDNPKDPVMGTYFDVIQTGKVKKGDPVYIQYTK